MREAALSWTTAVQLADDEQAAARRALRDGDPAAPFDDGQTRREFPKSDDGGYVRQALAAIRRAARLARNPRERGRAEARRQRWERSLRPLTISSHLPGTVESDRVRTARVTVRHLRSERRTAGPHQGVPSRRSRTGNWVESEGASFWGIMQG